MRNRWLVIVATLIIIFVGCYFVFRKKILDKMINRYALVIETTTGMHLSVKHAGFVGFKTIYLSQLTLENNKNKILRADSIVISPRFLPLLAGKKKLKELSFYGTQIYVDDALIENIRSKMHASEDDTTFEHKKISYSGLISFWKKTFFKMIPSLSNIRNASFSFNHDSVISTVYVDLFNYQSNEFAGDLMFTENKLRSKCFVKGYFDQGSEKASVSIIQSDTSHVHLPFLGKKWKSSLSFDSATLAIDFPNTSESFQQIKWNASVAGLVGYDARIGPDPVVTKTATFNLLLNIGNRYLEVDSSSTVTINRFSFAPYLRFEKNPGTVIHCSFIKKEFDASDLFESLPDGLFSNFKGLQASGKLVYHMKAIVNLDHPDSTFFETNLENKGFKITKYGVTDFRMINGTFRHDVYEHDQFVKAIMVGPENPDFISIQDISPNLKYAILTSEDGDFYYHHGFNERAFRESIITNLKEKRFARGGSTLTMQLVKNAFLSRNKTISRKVEEALIVWIIENLHLVNKDRMFEVYLNIIEWGPYVYGIKPAAKFYFNKLPGNLTLSESIYLTSIIPRPKAFKYTFISNGEMAGFYAGYSKLLTSIMLRRNQINTRDSANLKPYVKLTGEAKKYLATTDTMGREDSLFYLSPNPLILDNGMILEQE